MPLRKATGSFQNLNASGAALGEARPATHGLIAWSWDPSPNANSSLVTNGTVYLSAVYPSQAANITKVYWQVTTVGVAPVSNQNKVGLFDSTGSLLTSTIVDADVTATAGLRTTTIASTAVSAGGLYWVGFVFNAGTAPTLARGTATVTAVNIGLTAATFRHAINGTGQTTLASITPASNAAPAFSGPWAAIGV